MGFFFGVGLGKRTAVGGLQACSPMVYAVTGNSPFPLTLRGLSRGLSRLFCGPTAFQAVCHCTVVMSVIHPVHPKDDIPQGHPPPFSRHTQCPNALPINQQFLPPSFCILFLGRWSLLFALTPPCSDTTAVSHAVCHCRLCCFSILIHPRMPTSECLAA